MSVVGNCSCARNRNCRCYGKWNAAFLWRRCRIGDHLLKRLQRLMVGLRWLGGGRSGLMECTVGSFITRVYLTGEWRRCRKLCSLISRIIVLGGRRRLAATVGCDVPLCSSLQLAFPIRFSIVSRRTEWQRPVVMIDWR